MKYTLKQLFSIVDGRLATNIEDVYAILGTATGEQLMTHHLPTASNFVKKIKPGWYEEVSDDLSEIKKGVGDNFLDLMIYIDNNCSECFYEVNELSENEKKGFGEYMLNNSLLLNKSKP